MSNDSLPPVPPPDAFMTGVGVANVRYTREQMREYGAACLRHAAAYFDRPDTMMYRSEVAAAIRRMAGRAKDAA